MFAQCILGKIYENGEGVTKDYEKAIKWYIYSAYYENHTAVDNLYNILSNKNEIIKLLINLIMKNEKDALLIEHLRLYPGTDSNKALADLQFINR